MKIAVWCKIEPHSFPFPMTLCPTDKRPGFKRLEAGCRALGSRLPSDKKQTAAYQEDTRRLQTHLPFHAHRSGIHRPGGNIDVATHSGGCPAWDDGNG